MTPTPDADVLLDRIESGLSRIERILDKGLRHVARVSLIRSAVGKLGGLAAGRSLSPEERAGRGRRGGRKVFYGSPDVDGADFGRATSHGKLLRERRRHKDAARRVERRSKAPARPSNVVDLPRQR